MQKFPAALLAACSLSMGLGAFQAHGGTSSNSQPFPIGAQPVPDTPVAHLPAHAGHSPIAEPCPQPATHPAEPTPPPAKYSREWVVSPSGSDTAEGNSAHPFQTIGKAVSVAGPGALIRVLAGNYAERIILGSDVRAGTASAKITLQGEGTPHITPGPGWGALVQVHQPNWVIDGFKLDVAGQPIFGVTFEGNVSGSVLANSELYNGTGGGGVTTFNQAKGATIENNHIHNFVRTTGNQDSHGVVVQPTSRDITVRNNDIHDNSGDSVQCIGPEGFSSLPPAQGVLVEYNHLYNNRENAVDIKTCYGVTVRNNRMHHFRPTATAKGDAVVVHMSASNVVIEDNEIYDASKGISVGGNHTGPMPESVLIRRNRVHDLTTAGGGEGSGIRLENSEGAMVLNNTITRAPGGALILGHGTGGPTDKLTVENNIIDSPVAVSVGGMHPGLKMAYNLYPASARFASGPGLVGLDAFKKVIGDTTSKVGNASVASNFAPSSNAVDVGLNVGLPYCGRGPDIGAVETNCS